MEDLPLRQGDMIPQQETTMFSFLRGILEDGNNVFSIRFKVYQYNACLYGYGAKAEKAIRNAMYRVLTCEEAESLTMLPSFTEKLAFISRKIGYNACVADSFDGKNLVNLLHALAKEVTLLAGHALASMEGHPDGTGAQKYYRIASEAARPEAFRPSLMEEVRRLCPQAIKADGSTPVIAEGFLWQLLDKVFFWLGNPVAPHMGPKYRVAQISRALTPHSKVGDSHR